MLKQSLLAAMLLLVCNAIFAQDTLNINTDLKKIDLSNRPNDHFMLQYGYDGWAGTNDTINPQGFSRHFNIYMMLDKPFKNNPHFSVGIGVGLGSSNMFFTNTYIDLKSNSETLPFKDVSAANHFDKYKLTTIFFELPLELRWVGNPVNPDKGLKFALGAKGGFLLNAYTKGKNMVDSAGTPVFGDKYKSKEYERKFINTTRIAFTGRIGLGNVSLDGSYQVTSFLKEGTGPKINPWSLGITLSGL